MKEVFLMLGGVMVIVLLAGCRSPEFAYNAPPAGLDVSGPGIVVLPLVDERTDRQADHVFRKGYLANVQGEIGQELQSMKVFSSVIVATNRENLPNEDFQLTPTLRRLDCEVLHHGRVSAEKTAFYTVQVVVGVPLGSVYSAFKIPVYGNSALDVTVRRTTDQKLFLNGTYSGSVTNRVKKSVCNKPETKATVMLAAFQYTQTAMKDDLLREILEDKYANAAGRK